MCENPQLCFSNLFLVDHEEHPDEEKYVPYSHIRIRNKVKLPINSLPSL